MAGRSIKAGVVLGRPADRHGVSDVDLARLMSSMPPKKELVVSFESSVRACHSNKSKAEGVVTGIKKFDQRPLPCNLTLPALLRSFWRPFRLPFFNLSRILQEIPR
jgi:hypothetical protein